MSAPKSKPGRARRYLVTGASGFLGRALAEHLLRKGGRVFGTYRTRRLALKGATLFRCDFRDAGSVRAAVRRSRPDVVFHFAAQSNIPASWKDFSGTIETNVGGTPRRRVGGGRGAPRARGARGGSRSEPAPARGRRKRLNEDSPLRPTNPYALSKVGADLLGGAYASAFGLSVVRAIPFYVVGPRKEPDAPSDFAKAVAARARGGAGELRVGNLSSIRDVVDVRDATAAFAALAEKGRSGCAYNLCSGRETSLREILRRMIRLSGSDLKVRIDPKKFRVADDARLVGDPGRLRKLGWKPRYSLDDTLESVLDYWKLGR